MYINIQGKKIGPYLGILSSDGSTQGDILEIIYDTAIIELYKDQNTRYTLAYKKSKNILGGEMKYADIINEVSGETFSLQVKNIFFAKIIENDLKILALVGEEIKCYQNFGKQEILIEFDGDKIEKTPLGYYDMFVSYDDYYYYPFILNPHISKNSEIKKFYDYFGYKAYEDEYGKEHLIMLIEHETSNDREEIWYFIDNFNIISPKVDFGNESEYVEEWDINENGDIFMTVTSGAKWYLERVSQKLLKGEPPKTQKAFTFTRVFEDSDGDFIVAQNEKGYFIINRNKTTLSERDIGEFIYFKKFLFHKRKGDFSYFLMENQDDEIVLVNENGFELITTDLSFNDDIKDILFQEKNMVQFLLTNKPHRLYMF